jgi:hypothetical protein
MTRAEFCRRAEIYRQAVRARGGPRFRIVDTETGRAELTGVWADGQLGPVYSPHGGTVRTFPTLELAELRRAQIADDRGHQVGRYEIEAVP